MADVGKKSVTLPYINSLTLNVVVGEADHRAPRTDSQATAPADTPTTGRLTHRKSKKSLGPVPLSDLVERHVSVDSADADWVVESPRKVQHEKTMIAQTTDVTAPLEVFFEETVNIPEKRLGKVRSKSNALLDYLMPRLTKLAKPSGMKVTGHFFGGGTFDDSAVVLPYEVEIFLLLDVGKTKLDALEGGYRVIPLRRFHEKPGHPPDQYRFGRSDSGLFLSSLRTAKLMHELIDRSLRLSTVATLLPFTCNVGKPQIAITVKRYTFHLTPAIHLPKEGVYLVTQPYAYDVRPWHELAWRVSYIEKERKMLATMDKADRGARRKAFKLLKAFVRVEHTMEGLTSYHIKTVLLHTFDSAVDTAPRWQRDPVETAFLGLLRQLYHYLSARTLPHFFISSCNLFRQMDNRRLASLQARVGYLLDNEKELVRVLRKRSE